MEVLWGWVYQACPAFLRNWVTWTVNQASAALQLLITWWTGRSELERLCLGGTDGEDPALRQASLERFLLADDLDVWRTAKRAGVPESDTRAARVREVLTRALSQRELLARLTAQANEAAKAAVSWSVDEHRQLLGRVWDGLRPGVRRSGDHTAEWQEIGFQGNDPCTDFRGAGVLGLRQLASLVEQYPALARRVLSDSARPNWFGLSLASINLTFDLLVMLRAGELNRHLLTRGATLEELARLHAAAVAGLNEAWTAANPPDIMSYQAIRRPFLDRFRAEVAAGTLQHPPQQ